MHKRALSLVYKNFWSSFSELLEKDKSVTIHHRNFQTLADEIFKVKKTMAPEILTEIFPQKESNYSLRNSTTLQGRSIKTIIYGSETISSLGPKIWGILLTELKRTVSPTLFKRKIREWTPKNCPCRLYNCPYPCTKHWICVSYLYVHILLCKLKYFKHM